MAVADMQIEIELKLLARDSRYMAELWRRESIDGWQVAGRRVERQHNVYYDTADNALKVSGASLRWRRREGEPIGELTLKTDRERRDSIFLRSESTVRLPAEADPLDADAAPPLAAARQLAGSRLSASFTIETERHVMNLRRGESRVELALDVVTMPGTRFKEHEIEAELERGSRADLEALKRILTAGGRARPTEHGKRGRALRYLEHQRQSASRTAPPESRLAATPSATSSARPASADER